VDLTVKTTKLLIIDYQTEKLLATLSNRSRNNVNFFDAIHEEKLSGDNVFEFSMISDHPDAAHVIEGNYVGYRDPDGITQLFQIYKIEEESDGGRVYRKVLAEHCSYELMDDIIESYNGNNVDIDDAMINALAHSRWSLGNLAPLGGTTDVDYHYISAMTALKQAANKFGGELLFRVELSDTGQITGRYVDLLARRGSDTGKRFRYDRDLHNTIRRVDMTQLKTALFGRGAAVEQTEGGLKRKIDIKDVVWSKANGDPVDKPLGQGWIGDPEALLAYGRNNGTRHRFGVWDEGRSTDPNVLIQNTWEKLQQLNKPIVSYQMGVVDLEEITELPIDKIRIGDTIQVVDNSFYPVVRVEARIVELIRAIDEPEKTRLILGNFLELVTNNLTRRIHQLETDLADGLSLTSIGMEGPIEDDDFPDVAPPIPTEVEASGNFRTIMLNWNYNGASYIRYYEVYASQLQGFNPDSTNLIFRGKTGSYIFEGTDVNEIWYFRIRAVNTHNTAGPFSGEISASTIQVGEGDIQERIITNELIAEDANIDGAKIANATIGNAHILGKITAEKLEIGSQTTFADGYDPSDKADKEIENQIVYKIEIISSNGLVFKNDQIQTTLEARVYHGSVDVTNSINASRFKWSRVSADTEGDIAWNIEHAGGTKSVVVTGDDVHVRATFNVELLEM
jgi:phage minor structural protein